MKILHLGILGSCSPFPRVSRSAPSLEQKALRPLLTIIITITIIIVIIIITITIIIITIIIIDINIIIRIGNSRNVRGMYFPTVLWLGALGPRLRCCVT